MSIERDRDAALAQVLGERHDPGHGVREGRRLGELGADVHLDPEDLEAPQRLGDFVRSVSLRDGDAELRALETGGDVRVRLRIDVGIDPERDREPERPWPERTSSSARNSLTDSTLNIRISALSASRISSRVLPTPEKMIFFGGTPARRARYSSPPRRCRPRPRPAPTWR